jgi:lipopolysaccharide/colanic/teichoic acid biosynthesis glycosyltransferase
MLRIVDVVISFSVLTAISPVIIFVLIILKLSGEGELFYLQDRVGRNGIIFSIIKFATMIKSSPSIGTGEITLKNDPRVLPFGRILRKTKFNEVPQFWNVLVGDMSLLGPRPMTQASYSMLNETDRVAISSVRPGLSGVGSILFRDEESILSKVNNPNKFDWETVIPYKIKLEKWFIKNLSFKLYLQLIGLTLMIILLPKGWHLNWLLKQVPAPPEELNKFFK